MGRDLPWTSQTWWQSHPGVLPSWMCGWISHGDAPWWVLMAVSALAPSWAAWLTLVFLRTAFIHPEPKRGPSVQASSALLTRLFYHLPCRGRSKGLVLWTSGRPVWGEAGRRMLAPVTAHCPPPPGLGARPFSRTPTREAGVGS